MKTCTGLAHIAVFTKDIEKTISFYEKLGGVCTAKSEVQKPQWVNKLALIELNGFVLEAVQPGGGDVEYDTEKAAFAHIALCVDNLEKAIEEVKESGIDSFISDIVELPTVFGGVRNIFFTGPSGEQIELIQNM